MEILIYSKEFTYLGAIDTIISLMWTRSYWDVGNFKLLIPFNKKHWEWLSMGNIVFKKGDSEAAEITYNHINQGADGIEQIEVQGKFITNWLDQRCVLTTQKLLKPSHQVIEQLVNENLANPSNSDRKMPSLYINNAAIEGNNIEYATERGLSVLLSVGNVAKAAKLGYRTLIDVRNKKYAFEVYKGIDRTADQSKNSRCFFATEYDNVKKQEYTRSVENKKTVAYVLGEETETQPQELIAVGSGSGFERKELFISATDVSRTIMDGEEETTLTEQQYKNLLYQRGIEGLEQNCENLSFKSDIRTDGNLKYKIDFDVGDRVTCKNSRWGIQIDVRITSITENYQKDKNSIDITFGESLPTLVEKIKKRRL